MTIARLVYSSHPTTSVASRELFEILEISESRNAAVGLTGLLCHSADFFLQVLEGEPDAVCTTFYRIVRDPRHDRVRLLDFSHVPRRMFGEWNMGLAGIGDIRTELIARHSPTGDLAGLEDDAAAAVVFVDELAAAMAHADETAAA